MKNDKKWLKQVPRFTCLLGNIQLPRNTINCLVIVSLGLYSSINLSLKFGAQCFVRDAAAFRPLRLSALFGAIRQLECLGVYLIWGSCDFSVDAIEIYNSIVTLRQCRTQRGYMMTNGNRVSLSEGGTYCVGNIHICGLVLFSVR